MDSPCTPLGRLGFVTNCGHTDLTDGGVWGAPKRWNLLLQTQMGEEALAPLPALVRVLLPWEGEGVQLCPAKALH